MKNKESKLAKNSYAGIRFTRNCQLFSKEFKGTIIVMATNLEDNPDNIITIGTNSIYPSQIKGGMVKVLDFYPGHNSQIPIFKEGYTGDRCSRSYDYLMKYLNNSIEKVVTYDEYCTDNKMKSLTPEFIFQKAENKSGFKYVRLKKVSIIGEIGINDDLSWNINPGVSRLIIIFPLAERTIFQLTDPIYFQSDRSYHFEITSSGVRFVKCLAKTPQ